MECPNSHINEHGATFCSTCGERLQTPAPKNGRRPDWLLRFAVAFLVVAGLLAAGWGLDRVNRHAVGTSSDQPGVSPDPSSAEVGDQTSSPSPTGVTFVVQTDGSISATLSDGFLQTIAAGCAQDAAYAFGPGSTSSKAGALIYNNVMVTVSANKGYDSSSFSSNLMWSGKYEVSLPLEIRHADGSVNYLDEACYANDNGVTQVDAAHTSYN